MDKTDTKRPQVVWLDPDVHFLNSNWVNDTSARLDEVNVVQPFAFAYELRASDDTNKLDANEASNFMRGVLLCVHVISPHSFIFPGSGIRKHGHWARVDVLWRRVRCTSA